MKLKKLILQGYKTFASKTEFHFDAGITAIVGPNGSGKSNIADAVRWVLGEQSYSTLRGKRTTDMIFAGSSSRPRAGMAQAILTLDNSDGWLPIDFAEVEIGRRAFRSGENEYILNGQKVRLKDVTDLLATSGLAQRTYTIIGQGLVDQALSLRAEERRALFEEAAGINHYKTRRAATLRRLQETQRNLQRIHDILAEIRPRLTSLKRQATRAQNYEQLTADLNHLLRIWYGYRWEQAKTTLRDVRETAVATEKAWQQARQKLRVLQENSDDLRHNINRVQQRLTNTQEQRDDVRDRLEEARRQSAILQERSSALTRQLAELEADAPALETQQTQAGAELDSALQALAAAQSQMTVAQTELRQFNSDFQAQQAAITAAQRRLAEARQKREASQQRLAQAEGQLSQLRERLQESAPPAAETADPAWQRLQERIEKETAVLANHQKERDALQAKRAALQTERQTLIGELKKLRRSVREAETTLNQERSQTARLEARVEMLDKLRPKAAFSQQVNGLLGNLAGQLTIPSQYQPALEAALQNRLTAWIFENGETLWAALHAAGDGSVTAVALDQIPPPPPSPQIDDPAAVGWAHTLVTCPSAIQPLVDRLLGALLLVDTPTNAYRLARQLPPGALAVTPDGFVATADGIISRPDQDADNSVLAREDAWRAAQEALGAQQQQVETAVAAVQAQQNAIEEKQDTVDALREQERELEQQLNDRSRQAARAQRELDRSEQQREFLAQQRTTQQQAYERLQTRIAEIEAQVAEQETAVAATAQAVTTAAAELDALPVAEAQQQREGLQQAIQTARTVVAGRQAVVDSRRATLNQLDGQLQRLRARQERLRQQQNALNQEQQADKRQQLQDELARLDAAIKPMKAELRQQREALANLEEKTAVAQKETHDAETSYTQARLNFTQHKNEIEALQERIKNDLGVISLSYDDDQTGPTPLPIDGIESLPQVSELPDDIEETIQTYRAQMHRIGSINPDAPAEYDETQTRYDFLLEQIDDLTETEAQLREIIAELDELTSRAFAETVERVNDVFGDTFSLLFGGGAARLVLTDPDDLTISGVDIIARLPNRREQGLGLLSGGERSLTAAALIFSLLKVSPTPFCVMDEVDAALDEANINRFRGLLQELSRETQFIIITHNRGTVQAARTIYGISMGNDSASQVISIKPEDYVKQKELV